MLSPDIGDTSGLSLDTSGDAWTVAAIFSGCYLQWSKLVIDSYSVTHCLQEHTNPLLFIHSS